MNGLNSVGGAGAGTGLAAASGPAEADFDAIFATGVVNTSAVLMQFIGADILQSVMKSDTAVD